jgi:MFS family permease
MGEYLSVASASLTQAASAWRRSPRCAASCIPQTWKFLWAPVADTTLSRKTWYLLAGVVSAVGIFVTGAVPADAASLPLLYAAVLISNVASTFLAMATESLMVYNTPPELQGRAGGWFQAGNLGGNGLGGGAGLWLAQTLPDPWMAAAAIAVACALCCAALWFVPEPPPLARTGNYGRMLIAVLKDLSKWVRAKPAFWRSHLLRPSVRAPRAICGRRWPTTMPARTPWRWRREDLRRRCRRAQLYLRRLAPKRMDPPDRAAQPAVSAPRCDGPGATPDNATCSR